MPAQDATASGLSSKEASERLTKDGSNSMPDTSAHLVRDALTKFWAPVPWLLEALVVLQIVLHKYVEAAVIAGLLVFNGLWPGFRKGRSQATLCVICGGFLVHFSSFKLFIIKNIPNLQTSIHGFKSHSVLQQLQQSILFQELGETRALASK